MDYPKYFPKCPLCESTMRVVGEEMSELKKEGKISLDRIPASNRKLLPLMDLGRAALSFPVLQFYQDVCQNCGFEYTHTITNTKMTIDQLQVLMQQLMGIGSPQR